MIINTKIVAGALIAGTIGLGGVASVSAATTTTDASYSPIVEKIASKFNLNKDEVKKVFDEQHNEREAERQKNLEDKLTQAVKDGKITEDQKIKLLAKLQELHKTREANRQNIQEAKRDMQQAMQNERTELEQWAKDNGIINLKDLMPTPPDGGHGRHMDGNS